MNTVSITTVCGNVNELSSPALHTQGKGPEVRLRCQRGKHISAIEFASYGNPTGDCTTFSVGSCHAELSESVVKQVTNIDNQYDELVLQSAHLLTTSDYFILFFQACIGKRGCSIPVSPARFGGDPCPGIQKSLLVVANCR